MKYISFVVLLCVYLTASQQFGPKVRPTNGEPIPKPQHREQFDGYMIIRPLFFSFKIVNEQCSIFEAAVQRYKDVIFQLANLIPNNQDHAQESERDDNSFYGYLDNVSLNLTENCGSLPLPTPGMNESYVLQVNTPEANRSAVIESSTPWGILRGMETLTQILYLDSFGVGLRVQSTKIVDYPRFPYRGFMLDTSRHFFPVQDIKKLLDAMEINKFNVFHWHIVDDQSFPYTSSHYPRLSTYGAYSPDMVYSQDDVMDIHLYAIDRGIRIVPEFDTPGHTLSWGEGYPTLLTPCYKNGAPDGTFGPINPAPDTTYNFLETLFNEVTELFGLSALPSFLHLGGDEVDFDCWKSNPDIAKLMERLNISNNYPALESYYIEKIINITTKQGARNIVWQEVFDNKVNLDKNTIVHVWKDGYQSELKEVTNSGFSALLSSCWYLSEVNLGGDWSPFYKCDPQEFIGNSEQKELVFGGEACMWGEYVDHTNIHQRVWPRASAVAERLWSASNITDTDDMARRLEEHTCRMRKRGIPAQPPNGPGFCPLI